VAGVSMGAAKPKGKPRGPGRPFQKGQSGNPAGFPKERAEFLAIARSHVPEAIECLVEEVRNRGDHRIVASVKLMEWGLGKPANAPEDRDAIMQASRPLASISADRLLSIIDAVDEDDEPSEG